MLFYSIVVKLEVFVTINTINKVQKSTTQNKLEERVKVQNYMVANILFFELFENGTLNILRKSKKVSMPKFDQKGPDSYSSSIETKVVKVVNPHPPLALVIDLRGPLILVHCSYLERAFHSIFTRTLRLVNCQ